MYIVDSLIPAGKEAVFMTWFLVTQVATSCGTKAFPLLLVLNMSGLLYTKQKGCDDHNKFGIKSYACILFS